MKNENVTIPLIVSGALVITSFVPVLQILLMYLNGVIIYVIMMLIGEGESIQYLANSLLSLVSLVLFYKAQKTWWKVCSAVLAVSFFLPLFTYYLGGKVSEDYYFLPMMLAGLASGITLLIIGLLKSRTDNIT